MESGELSLDHFSIATSSIREKLRKQRRQDHIQNSFKATRQKMLAQEQQQSQRKQMQKMARALRSASPMKAQQVVNNVQNSANHLQNYNQSSCFNVSIANLNFGNNPSYNPQISYNQNDQNISNQINAIKNIQNILHRLQPLAIPQQQQQEQLCSNVPTSSNKITDINQAVHNNNNNRKADINSVSPAKIPVSPYKIHCKHKNYLVYDHIIGTGTYSKVYLGLDMLKNEKVAVKAITQLEENQIKVLMSVDSPYIIKLQDFWKQSYGHYTYLVLDLCDSNLRQQLKKGLTYNQVVAYLEQIVEGMDALFSKNIIHRDLKFQNVLVTKNKVAKITDFGLAKDMGMMSNVASLRCGTPYTMAPEIFFHAGYNRPYYSQKCDIWSLGVILHQMLYKKHPFNYQSDRMARMQRTRIDRKFGYLDCVIDGALVKDPQKRMNWNELKQIVQMRGADKMRQIPNQSKSNDNKRRNNFDNQIEKDRISHKQLSMYFNKEHQKKQQLETSIEQTAEQSQIHINLHREKPNPKQINKVNHKSKYQQPIKHEPQSSNTSILVQLKSPSCNPMVPKPKSQQKLVLDQPVKREDPYKIFRQPIKQVHEAKQQKIKAPNQLTSDENKSQQFIIPSKVFKWEDKKQLKQIEQKPTENKIVEDKRKQRDSSLMNSLNTSSHGSTLLLKLMFGVVAVMLATVLLDLSSI